MKVEELVKRLRVGGACKWGENVVTAVQAKEAGCTLDDLVRAASALARRDKDVERRLRLWMADCAAHVLHLYERYGTSEAPRNAIISHRKFARGEIDASAISSARAYAIAAAKESVWVSARAASISSARAAARAAAGTSEWASSIAYAREVAREASWAAAWASANSSEREAAREAEETWQLDRLVSWMSDDEPVDWPLPASTAFKE